jgi:aryl-alcohol dehydrogenase-like predicted oxidoreductase
LSLAWLIAQPQTNAIAGARNTEQAVGNASAADVDLSADELTEIDAIGRLVTEHLDENPVMWDWD